MTPKGTQRTNEESDATDSVVRDDDSDPNPDAQKVDAVGEKPAEAPSRNEQSLATEVPPTEAPSVQSSAPSDALPSAEAAPPATEAAPPAETAPADAAPPDAASADLPGPTQAEPPAKEVPVEQAPASVPPAHFESTAPPVSSVAPAIEITDEWSPRSTFWSTRPNRAWMLVGGSAIVIAFFVGALTGRVVQRERSGEFVAPASLAVSPAPTTLLAPADSLATPLLPSSVPPSAVRAPAKRGQPAFNAKAAKAAIDGIAPRLKACRYAGDPTGPASVMVTFAPAGSVSNASVTTTGYAGTRTESCIVQRLRDVRIPEFTGGAVTVKRSVTVR